MIPGLVDQLALWWLDRRTRPDRHPDNGGPPTGVVRYYGGPLDGSEDDLGPGATTMRVTALLDGQYHYYRADGTHDPDGARRLHHDPEREDQ